MAIQSKEMSRLSTLKLYARTSSHSGIYMLFLVNRMQMLFYILIMPLYLVHPYMLWAIVAVGLLSQLNLMVLSKWFASDFAAQGYEGFVRLFGRGTVRLFAVIGLLLLMVKITVITLGYVDIVNLFIFPSMDRNWLVLAIVASGCYVAVQGMEQTIRFIIIVILCSAWIVSVYIPFLLPPIASVHELYPLLPIEWTPHTWKGFLFIWSSMSGPEYLICIALWLNPRQSMVKYFTIGNAVTVVEYLILFIASLLFYGSNYLSKSHYPVVNMVRYLQSPVFERIDILLVSIHLFHFVFAISLFLLYFYGAIRMILGLRERKTSRSGYLLSSAAFLTYMLIVNEWFWQAGTSQNNWTELQIWLGAGTYAAVPALLLLLARRKERVRI